MQKSPEILAPVGTWEMCLAAVHNGASAIYLGMPGFNARGRSETIELETLAEMIKFCHLYNVKVFLACNILLFEAEIDFIIDLLKQVLILGPDALIVQDIGLVRLINSLAPSQVVHASTQMTLTSVESIAAISDLNIARYVLARELSLNEIAKIRAGTDKELEVFVHGALCVSYSGQCLTSESLGGRSANRGQCAQSCRLPYELIVDDQKLDLKNRHYLVSPQDLCSLDEIPKLIEIGIESFKIEGRLKSAEYVAGATQAYYNQIFGGNSVETTQNLEKVYSRGFFSGWLHGVNHQALVRADYGSHFGLEVGKIVSISNQSLIVVASQELKAGQGLLFYDSQKQIRIGSPIYKVKKLAESSFEIELDDDLELNKLKISMQVFVNSDPELEHELKKSFNDRSRFKRIPIIGVLSGEIGSSAVLELNDSSGNSVSVSSEDLIEVAKKNPLESSEAMIELSGLSNTPYQLEEFKFEIAENSYLSQRSLRKLKQKGVQALSQVRISKPLIQFSNINLDQLRENKLKPRSINTDSKLSVLLREESQLEILPILPANTIVYLDFEYGKRYDQAILKIREHKCLAGIATTRILKPQELGHLHYIQRLAPDLVLVRNLGALNFFKASGLKLVGDFSLNITNSLTAAWMLEQGFLRITPAYDLNSIQLKDLLTASDSNSFEVTIHQYMPAFHMEHCVFAAFLSKGTSWRDCGKPCEKHRVELRDPKGKLHPLKADAECRNTMFNGEAQSAALLVEDLKNLGVEFFRFEALFESPELLKSKISAYLKFLNGEISLASLKDVTAIEEKYGVSEGQLLSIRKYKDRKKDGGFERPRQVVEIMERF